MTSNKKLSTEPNSSLKKFWLKVILFAVTLCGVFFIDTILYMGVGKNNPQPSTIKAPLIVNNTSEFNKLYVVEGTELTSSNNENNQANNLECVAQQSVANSEQLELTSAVVDNAGVLTAEQKHSLTQRLMRIHDDGLAQIAVVTVPSTNGEDIFDYAMSIAERWKLGSAEDDDGLLIVVAVDDRQMYIVSGYGLEGALPDVVLKRFIEKDFKPEFKNANYYGGLTQGLNRIETRLSNDVGIITKVLDTNAQRDKDVNDAAGANVIFLQFILLLLAGAIIRWLVGLHRKVAALFFAGSYIVLALIFGFGYLSTIFCAILLFILLWVDWVSLILKVFFKESRLDKQKNLFSGGFLKKALKGRVSDSVKGILIRVAIFLGIFSLIIGYQIISPMVMEDKTPTEANSISVPVDEAQTTLDNSIGSQNKSTQNLNIDTSKTTLVSSNEEMNCFAIQPDQGTDKLVLNGAVIDGANILTPQQKLILTERLMSLYNQRLAHVGIVTVQNVPSFRFSDYINTLEEQWHLGNHHTSSNKSTNNQDNGLLIVLSAKNHEMQINAGDELTNALPPAVLKHYIEKDISPFYKNEEYFASLMTAVDKVEDRLNSDVGFFTQVLEDNASQNIKLDKMVGANYGFIFLLVVLLAGWFMRCVFGLHRKAAAVFFTGCYIGASIYFGYGYLSIGLYAIYLFIVLWQKWSQDNIGDGGDGNRRLFNGGYYQSGSSSSSSYSGGGGSFGGGGAGGSW